MLTMAVVIKALLLLMTMNYCATQEEFNEGEEGYSGFDYLAAYLNRTVYGIVEPECEYPYISKVNHMNHICTFYSTRGGGNWKFAAWYYEPKKGSCQPFYSRYGENECPTNKHLTKSHKLCTFKCTVPPCVAYKLRINANNVNELCNPMTYERRPSE